MHDRAVRAAVHPENPAAAGSWRVYRLKDDTEQSRFMVGAADVTSSSLLAASF
jgi:hypothetical protein